MSGVLEHMRARHEEVEKLERMVTKELDRHGSDQLRRSHRIAHLVDRVIHVTGTLVRSYENHDHLMAADELTGTPDPFVTFYGRIQEIRSSQNHPLHGEEEVPVDCVVVRFSAEECMGRYLDLHEHYHRYIAFAGRMSYSTYLDNLHSLGDNSNGTNESSLLPKKFKATKRYREYLGHLVQYLVSFLNRTNPLMDLDRVLSELQMVLEDKYKGGYNSKKGKNLKHSLLMEGKLKKLCAMLKDTIAQTNERIQNRSAMRGFKELQDDRQEDEMMILGDDGLGSDEETNDISNPLQLPLGWDGKPIPYWLYKLHGLNQKFKCQICGDYTYRGRKEFERHFGEARHQSGMRCLGIPNAYAKCFHEITIITDAQKLWEEIQHKQALHNWTKNLKMKMVMSMTQRLTLTSRNSV